MAESDASTATIEVNEAVFCNQHQKEVVSAQFRSQRGNLAQWVNAP